MSDLRDNEEDKKEPVVIDISLKEQIRKERIVAAVLVLLILGLAYVIYLNRY
jgi:hypothetical protein